MLNLAVGRPTALANLIMALASYECARSPTELSNSPLYHYQYGSISDALSELARDETQRIAAVHTGLVFVLYPGGITAR